MMGADPEGGAAELAAMGVDRAIIPSFLFLNDTADAVAQFGESVVAKVSASRTTPAFAAGTL